MGGACRISPKSLPLAASVPDRMPRHSCELPRNLAPTPYTGPSAGANIAPSDPIAGNYGNLDIEYLNIFENNRASISLTVGLQWLK
jgi:hypothetical protein